MDEIEKIPVSSSNVEAIGYSEDVQLLRIWYLNGGIYDYHNVPIIEFEALKLAPSIGQYIHKNIKGSYGYTKTG